ncbi:glycogen synthase GlgA [Candidatus Enterococcus ikei]|uniref:Glycogen synthase n=1 Tax=Candidatus Enterococcus ikei TaxID=2815326 RepID=A0ABS3GY56_9ENTE|nr:glycogen synthase GlgA [Enterococcus sp. DIV0869a]MBO0440190.1 glycogen synthase GlgA [Enterococcus sp. DIV0869a]
MRVLFASAECAPFFKTGGLGDVAGALPKELAKKGVEISVVLPYFTKMPDLYKNQCEDVIDFYVDVGWRHQYCGIKRLQLNGVTYYFIDNLYYFDRENLYGYYDDGERFAFFSLAIIEMLEKINFIPDVIHVNDFHTAMIPFLLKEKYQEIDTYHTIKSILTIHNIEFQGAYSKDLLPDLFGMGIDRFYDGAARFGDGINYLKAGIMYADRVNTVSPTYAEEIKTPEFGFGLDGILRLEQGKLSGILNGIDYEMNDPETDKLIPFNYSLEDRSGKEQNKQALQKKMNLPLRKDVPLIGIVSRLTFQKGFHLILDELVNVLEKDVQVVLLGTGDTGIENSFRYFSSRYPDKLSANITFDVSLAQLIYAGSDLFLMPSATEPCGLSQMIAMRYGTLPIVHEVGGLKDTVIPFDPITKSGTGFGFSEFSSYYLMYSILVATDLYRDDQQTWQQLIQMAMKKDFSWKKSAQVYLDLYQEMDQSS